MSSSEDRREYCYLHGWVGRRAFQQERHDLCEVPVDALDTPDEEDESIALADETEDLPFGEDSYEDTSDEEGDEDEEDKAEDETPRWSRTSARQQGIPPKKTLPVRRITQQELADGRAELEALGADGPYWRPQTRGDCSKVPRPCPYVACKYSLFLDVSETGSIILNFPFRDPSEMPAHQSCALDLADQGSMTLEEIALVTNLTRERIRQVELKALIKKARPRAVEMGLGPDDLGSIGHHQVGPGADLEETGVEGAVPSDVSNLLSSGGGDD